MSCEQILKWGIWDFSKIESAEQFSESLFTWLEHNTYSSEADTRDAALAAGITIPADIPVPLNADGSYGENHSKTYSSAFFSLLRRDTTFFKQFSEVNRKADASIVAAWRDCMATAKTGVFIYLVGEPDSQELILKVQARPYTPGTALKLKIKTFDLPAHLEELSKPGLVGRHLQFETYTRLRRTGSNKNKGGAILIATDNNAYMAKLNFNERYISKPTVFENPSGVWQNYTGVQSTEVTIDNPDKDQWIEVKAIANAKGWHEQATVSASMDIDGRLLTEVSSVGTFNVSCEIPVQRIALRKGQNRTINLRSSNRNANANGVTLSVRR
jgi:hypothetical protein